MCRSRGCGLLSQVSCYEHYTVAVCFWVSPVSLAICRLICRLCIGLTCSYCGTAFWYVPLLYLSTCNSVRGLTCYDIIPKKEPSYIHTYRKNIRSLFTEPHIDGRPTYSGVWPGSPGGLLTTLLSLPQCHAAFSTIPSTLTWVDQSPIGQHVL